jgi:hypothetical protein
MSAHPAPWVAAPGSGQRGYVRLRRRWPLVMRGIWVTLAAFLLYSTYMTLPKLIVQMRTPCQPNACPWLSYTAPQIATITRELMPYDSFVTVILALGFCAMAVAWTMSAIIVWRRPDDWMAALVAFALLLAGSTLTTSAVPLGPTPWLNPNAYGLALLSISMPLVFGLFPSGRFAPRWTLWLLLLVVFVQVPLEVFTFSVTTFSTPVGPIGWVTEAGVFVMLAGAQIYRYHAVSTPIERQQTKWALVGFAAPVALIVIAFTLTLVAQALGSPTSLIALIALFYPDVGFILPVSLAVGFGFAVMRSRLWEIDALVNRALVYGALTILLASLYAGLVIGLQAALRGVISQDNNLTIVFSTLVIAALTLPLRRWLQALIDRQFYRNRYDAAKTLETFSATLRQEIRVEALRERLLWVVDETMRPAHTSLWLRPAPPGERSPAARATGRPGAAEYRSHPNEE